MFKKMVLGIVFLLIMSGVVYAEPAVEVEGLYWMPKVTAKGKVEESGIGSDLNFKSDLGIKEENLPEIRISLYPVPNNKIRFAYTQVHYSGEHIVQQSLNFNGRTYSLGSRVNTDLRMKYLRLGWIWHFINSEEKGMQIGAIVELKGFWGKMALDAPSLITPLSESEKFLAGLPTVGLCFKMTPHDKVEVFAELSGLTAGEYGYFVDGELGIKVVLHQNFAAVLGYRTFDVDAQKNSDYLKLKLKGAFLGGAFRF